MRDVRRNGGGSGLYGGPGKRVDGVFPGRSQSFPHQRRPVDDSSPGRGEMAQTGRTRGGTLHGEMDRSRKKQGWTTACSGMPERDGKKQEEDSLKQAGSSWFASPCCLATSRANLYPPGVWSADDMAFFLWCYVCFVLVRFSSLCFRLSRGPSFSRPSMCRHSDSHTYFFFFLGGGGGRCRFFRVFFPLSLCMESTSYVLSYRMVFFYLVTTCWIFYISLCENSINQSKKGIIVVGTFVLYPSNCTYCLPELLTMSYCCLLPSAYSLPVTYKSTTNWKYAASPIPLARDQLNGQRTSGIALWSLAAKPLD